MSYQAIYGVTQHYNASMEYCFSGLKTIFQMLKLVMGYLILTIWCNFVDCHIEYRIGKTINVIKVMFASLSTNMCG